MEINELIVKLKRNDNPDWKQFHNIFIEEKLKEIQYTPKTEQALYLFNKVTSLIIDYIMKTQRNVQIETDLGIYLRDHWVHCYIKTHCIEVFDTSQIHLYAKKDDLKYKLQEITNSIPNEVYQKIVDSLPKWNEEFKTVCRENVRQIEAIIFGKFDPRYDILYHYLEQKIELMKFLCYGERGATASKLKALGFPFEKRIAAPESITRNGITFISDPIPNDWIIRCNNFTIEKGRWPRGKMIFNIANFGISPHQNLPAETIREIDRSIPQWIEEVKTIQHKLRKLYKIKQISECTAIALAKKQMRKLGCEYQLKKHLLEIKLLYNRKISIPLPINNVDALKRTLAHVPQCVEAVNSVPGEYCVKNHTRSKTTDKKVDNVDNKKEKWETDGFPFEITSEKIKGEKDGIPFEMTLEEIIVCLSKNRELTRQSESLTMDEIAQVCDEVPAYIDAINSVPQIFRIRPVFSGDKWVKEEV